MTVGELDTRMSSREFMEWMVYAQIEPFGPARQDYHASLISTVIANTQGNKVSPDDFIKPFEYIEAEPEPTEPDTFTDKQLGMMQIFKSMGGS